MNLKAIVGLLKDTFKEWNEDKAPRLGAALAYYTIFSLAPLLIIVIAIAGLVFGQQAAQGQIVGQIRGLVGEQGAEMIQTMISSSRKPSDGIIATVIGVVTLLLGALGVFGQLKDSLNTIWEVQPRPGGGILGMIKDRFLSFTMVLGTGFLLLVSLVLSAALSGLTGWLNNMFPGADVVLNIVNLVVPFAVITLMFAMIYKILPDAEIAWHDVWIGAIITSLLFTIGRFLIGLYLGRASVGSTYGAAGSLIVLLIWIYYSAQILFFGAEFTQVYANKYGMRMRPSENAMPVTEEARAQQGMPHTEKTQGKGKEKGQGRRQIPVTSPVPVKVNLIRQRGAIADRSAVPIEERLSPVNNLEEPQGTPSLLTTVFGFLVGMLAGISMSRSALSAGRPRRR